MTKRALTVHHKNNTKITMQTEVKVFFATSLLQRH